MYELIKVCSHDYLIFWLARTSYIALANFLQNREIRICRHNDLLSYLTAVTTDETLTLT